METLKYNSDQNNVLHLDCFPAVRLDSGKYSANQKVLVQVGTKVLGIAECIRHQSILLRNVTDSISLTLTGKDAPYLKAILQRMYPGTDWYRQGISYMHFRFVERYSEAPVTADVRKAVAVQASLNVSCRSYQSVPA